MGLSCLALPSPLPLSRVSEQVYEVGSLLLPLGFQGEEGQEKPLGFQGQKEQEQEEQEEDDKGGGGGRTWGGGRRGRHCFAYHPIGTPRSPWVRLPRRPCSTRIGIEGLRSQHGMEVSP